MTYPPPAKPDSTRASLLIRLRETSPQREIAWQEFYEQYAPMISGFARRMGARPQDIPDLTQDVLLGFFAVVPEFTYDARRGRFRGYLKTCTWRVFQRRMGRQLQFSGKPIDEIDPADPAIEQTWDDVWEAERLRRAVEAVRHEYSTQPERARTFKAFEMYAMLGRSGADTAAELGISIDSVHQAKSRVSRALRAAMETLTEQEG